MALNDKQRVALNAEMDQRKYFETMELKRAHMLKKNEFRNLTRFAQTAKQELADEDRVNKLKESQCINEAKIKHDEALAMELDQIKKEEIRELRFRQLLRENSHELRDLESKLRCAYINKQLAAQLAEKEMERLENKQREKEANAILDAAIYKGNEVAHMNAEKAILKKAQYKQELQDQMILQEQNRRCQYEEFLREKKMLDDVIQRIHEEDQRLLEEQMCKLLKTKEELVKFKEAQEIWRLREKKELEEENTRIEEYIKKRATEEQKRRQEKVKNEAVKTKICSDIAKRLYQEKAARQEREDIVQELMEHEKLEEMDRRHQEDVEKRIKSRIEIKTSLTKQMVERKEQFAEEARQDAAYKEQVLAKIMEDERLEQLSVQKRRLKMMQLRKDVEEMMVDRRQKRAEEMQRLIKVKELEQKEDENRQRLIECERLRMLKEHAVNLIGYIPRGILREDDLPHLGSNVMDYYKNLLPSKSL